MTVINQPALTAQEVAERIVRRAERESEKLNMGDRFEVFNSSELSSSPEMSTLLRCATLNFARTIKHDSSYAGIHYFEKVR